MIAEPKICFGAEVRSWPSAIQAPHWADHSLGGQGQPLLPSLCRPLQLLTFGPGSGVMLSRVGFKGVPSTLTCATSRLLYTDIHTESLCPVISAASLSTLELAACSLLTQAQEAGQLAQGAEHLRGAVALKPGIFRCPMGPKFGSSRSCPSLPQGPHSTADLFRSAELVTVCSIHPLPRL